ncbi:hypothetical protein EDD90_8166 [Streptomyces sp. Ag109_O5-1]|uniref:hypothetical protein n=1 Tax=Streptomyces sp. Ag109_O5-1 TaxID=1938851 RepID=UPI000F4F07AE|nr:hypothetical protein [Streptomyces sp. Ag109_O5-1]RPE44908.1 hypothetical protein EDD90_8166 [Streptomyces sp. Ag109_O5-1]
MRQQDVHDELRARLHEAAEAHEPDRARILARVERGMAPQAARPGHRATLPAVFGWVRVVSATAAVAAVLGVGGYAVASAVKDTHTEKTVAVSPTPSGTPDAATPAPSHSAAPPAHTPSKSASPKASSAPSSSPTASATPTAPVAKGEQDGPLWSDGSVDPHSNDFWAQSDVTLKVSQQLTALTVQLKVAQTGGVSNTGAWRSLPETDFTQTVAEQDGFLVYTWTLKPDAKVVVGQWVFAGQYNHERGGRDAKDDSYTITGSADGKQYTVTGDFATHTTTDGDS